MIIQTISEAKKTFGTSWKKANFNGKGTWPEIFCFYNGIWVCNDEFDGLYYSSDGKNWTLVYDEGGEGLICVDGTFYAGHRNAGAIVYSIDGKTWNKISIPDLSSYAEHLQYCSNSKIYFLFGYSEDDFFYSKNGKSWTKCAIPTPSHHNGLPRPIEVSDPYYGDLLASTHNRGLLKSTDYGKTWTQVSYFPDNESAIVENGKYVRSDSMDGLYQNTDTWGFDGEWQKICDFTIQNVYSHYLGRDADNKQQYFYLGKIYDTSTSSYGLYYSSDMKNWTKCEYVDPNANTTAYIRNIICVNGFWITDGFNCLHYSYDGKTWITDQRKNVGGQIHYLNEKLLSYKFYSE